MDDIVTRTKPEDRSDWPSPADLLELLPIAIYRTDKSGRITFFNQAAVELWGCAPKLGESEWCGSWRLYWPDGRPMPHNECPMAVTLRTGRPVVGAEAFAERPDGTRVPFLACPKLLFDSAGKVIGAINMLIDLTRQKRAERADVHLAAIVESSDDAIISKTLNGVIESWNQGAERLFGYSAAETVGRPIIMLIPEDRLDEEPRILARLRQGERVDHFETVRRRKDGSLVEISLTVSPVRDSSGRIIGASKIARDITDRRRAQQQQRLLLQEMNHRVKNLFAVVSGVVALSARSAKTAAQLAASVRERINALASAHQLTLPRIGEDGLENRQDTTLRDLVATVFAPYLNGNGSNEQLVVTGEDIAIGRTAVTSFALLIHEFATNAAKYGALSSPSGRIEIRIFSNDGILGLEWRERGGPPLNGEPGSEGFGSVLARETIQSQLGGTIDRVWRPDGLEIQVKIPIDRLGQ